MKFLVCVNFIGLAKAAMSVVRRLRELGHEVCFVVDGQGPVARDLRSPDSALQKVFSEAGIEPVVDHSRSLAGYRHSLNQFDAILVTLSPDAKKNTETAAVEYAKKGNVPVFGYTEVPCGHASPLWMGGADSYLGQLSGIFAAKVTGDLRKRFGDNAWEVGLQLDRFMSVDIPTVGMQTREVLEVRDDDYLVWVSGVPYGETIRMLGDTVGSLLLFCAQRLLDPHSVTLVVSRHARDKEIPGLTEAYREVMTYARDTGDLRVIECSKDHAEPQHRSQYAFEQQVEYRDLMCACCFDGGVMVTGHGTDGIVAPYIGLPSILCCASDYYDPMMPGEKGVHTFPLERNCPPQIGSHQDLEKWLHDFLLDPNRRARYVQECKAKYPLPVRPAHEIIADVLVKRHSSL